MKNIYFFFLLLLALSSCQSNKNEPKTINLEVSNYAENFALLLQYTSDLSLNSKLDSIKIPSGEKISLSEELLANANSILKFKDDDQFTLAFSKYINQPISIKLDLQKPDSIIVEGKQAKFIEYQLDQNKYWYKTYYDFDEKYSGLMKLDSKEYFMIQDSITQLRLQFLDDYFKEADLENQKDFVELERNKLIYVNLYDKVNTASPESIKRLDIYGDSLSDKPITYSEHIDFSNPILFESEYYNRFIYEFIKKDIMLTNPDTKITYDFLLNNGFPIIDKWFIDADTNAIEKTIFLNTIIRDAKISNAEIDVEAFRNKIDELEKSDYSKDYVSILDKNLDDLVEIFSKVAVGKRASDFSLTDENGNIYTLSEMSNKTIIIDVWASWCAPCIASFPKWNALAEKYKDNKNFEFLTVSIDKEAELWKNGLEKHQLEGLKLYAGEKAFDSDFAVNYNISAIPCYIVIDANGKIALLNANFKELEEYAENHQVNNLTFLK